MGTLEEIGLLDDQTQIEIPDEIPEEGSNYVPLVQPGKYVFQLPENMELVWTKVDSKKGPRVAAIFNRDNPITVVQDDTYDGYFNGSPVSTLLNNVEYPRGKERIEVADMYYLIQAFEAHLPKEQRTKLTNNLSFVNALKKYAGRMFGATLHWEAYCNPKKNIFVSEEDEDGNRRAVEKEGTPGCQARYTSYARDPKQQIPKNEQGFFVERFDEILVHGDPMGCPASLICNARLGRFTSVTK